MCQPLRRMMTATSTEMSGSAGVQPMVMMTSAAAMAPTEPSRSPTTWISAPRMLRFSTVAAVQQQEHAGVRPAGRWPR